MDYTHPLPLKSLITRFQPVFDQLNLGLSVKLSRLPHSGVSSLIQYLVSNSHISPQFTSRQLIYLHPDNLTSPTTSSLLREILRQSTGEISLITDEYVLLNQIKSDNKSKTIILDWSPDWDKLSYSAKPCLKSMYESGMSTTPHQINFLIIVPPDQNSPLFDQADKSFAFSLFSDQETIYSISRFLHLYHQNLTTKQIKDITVKSSGLAGLIKPLIELSVSQQDFFTHPKVQEVLNDLLKYRSHIPEKSKLSQYLSTYSPPEKLGDLTFSSPLSHQDILLIKKFQSNPNQSLYRDEIAQVLWGKLIESKYSDWAIDKAISRIRHKLSPSSNSKIITVKNIGYKLISL